MTNYSHTYLSTLLNVFSCRFYTCRSRIYDNYRIVNATRDNSLFIRNSLNKLEIPFPFRYFYFGNTDNNIVIRPLPVLADYNLSGKTIERSFLQVLKDPYIPLVKKDINNNIYYFGTGMILDEHFSPLVLITYTFKDETMDEITHLNIRVNPIVLDRQNVVKSFIFNKFIPSLHYLKRERELRGINFNTFSPSEQDTIVELRVIIDKEINDFFCTPNIDDSENINEILNEELCNSIDNIIDNIKLA